MGTGFLGTVTCHPGDSSDTGHQAGDTSNARHKARDTTNPWTWRETELSDAPQNTSCHWCRCGVSRCHRRLRGTWL